jgi:glucokinase-like ROK family protein
MERGSARAAPKSTCIRHFERAEKDGLPLKVDKYILAGMNRRNVLESIRMGGPINRAEIARRVDLSIPSVMRLVDEFIRNGLVKTIGKAESASTGGRRPDLLEFISTNHYICGIDVGRNTLKAIMMDLGGRIVGKASAKTGDDCSPGTVIPKLVSLVDGAIRGSGVDEGKIIGMGVGMPGLLDTGKGVVIFSPDYHWENVDLLGPLREHYNMNIALDNSNRALAMGEKWFGAGQASDYFVCVNLGHGIGSAIVQEGEIYHGSCGSSGEFGHITLERDGPVCDCGNRGCLEALASGNAIARQAKALAGINKSSLILTLAGGNADAIDAKTVFDAAGAGDAAANGIISQAIEYIGIGLASYINLFDPDMIILGGGMANAGDVLLNGIKETVRRRQMKHAGRKVKFVVGMRGDDATAVGAASFILKAFIESGGYLAERQQTTRNRIAYRPDVALAP